MLSFSVYHNPIICLSISEQNLLFLHFSRIFILAVLLFVLRFSFFHTFSLRLTTPFLFVLVF